MHQCTYHTTRLIAKALTEAGIHYEMKKVDNVEMLIVPFSIFCGPIAIARYICDIDGDVSVCILQLMNDIPPDKRALVLEVCNKINEKIRFYRFVLNDEGCIDVFYDIPIKVPDHALGAVAVEMFARLHLILNDEYAHLMRAIHLTDEWKMEHKTGLDLLAQVAAIKKHLKEVREDKAEDPQTEDMAEEVIQPAEEDSAIQSFRDLIDADVEMIDSGDDKPF